MRYALALVVLAVAAVAGAAIYTAYATDREYARQIAIGDAAVAAEQPFQALEAYSGAIARRPDSMLAHLKRGITYRDRGELDEAVRDLRRATGLDPTATQAHELLGDAQLSLQRYERAAASFQAFLAIDDRSPRVWYKLGLARYRAGQPTLAEAALNNAVTLDRNSPETYLLLGLALRDEGDLPRAQTALQSALRLSPGLTAPREALAAIFMQRDELALGIDQLEALAVLESTRPARHIALGLAHARAGHHEAAVLALSRAVERFPSEPQVYAALGHVWLTAAQRRGDPVALKKALEALSIAAGHPDASSESLTDLGRASLLSGDPAGAERVLRRAIARLPVSPDAFRHLATLAARGARIQEARDALIRYATLVGDATPAAVAMQIAEYSLALGDPAAAARWADRAEDESGPTPALNALRRRIRQ